MYRKRWNVEVQCIMVNIEFLLAILKGVVENGFLRLAPARHT